MAEKGSERARETGLFGTPERIGRRTFLAQASRRGLGVTAATLSLPALVAACGGGEEEQVLGKRVERRADEVEGTALVGDVLDFALTSDDWKGAFGFVTFRLQRAVFDGKDAFFIRTDASDEAFADRQKLVFVPKLAKLNRDGLAGAIYLFEDGAPDQAVVCSSQPGQDDWTPAWRVHRVKWKNQPKTLTSVADIETAKKKGHLAVEESDVVMNAAMVKWSTGELGVDSELTAYHGGQLVEAPDTNAMTVTFKLHECFPGSRYIVTDHSIEPAADMTKTVFAPRLQDGPSRAGATGRTNVFMNGIEGPGPMGFQPSAFDFDAGDPKWSPYWDHFTYAWKKGAKPRLLTTESAVHKARDAGDLNEFPGMPETKGEIFTVNCPVPVLAPTTFSA